MEWPVPISVLVRVQFLPLTVERLERQLSLDLMDDLILGLIERLVAPDIHEPERADGPTRDGDEKVVNRGLLVAQVGGAADQQRVHRQVEAVRALPTLADPVCHLDEHLVYLD